MPVREKKEVLTSQLRKKQKLIVALLWVFLRLPWNGNQVWEEWDFRPLKGGAAICRTQTCGEDHRPLAAQNHQTVVSFESIVGCQRGLFFKMMNTEKDTKMQAADGKDEFGLKQTQH